MSKQPIIEHLQKAGDIVDLVAHDDYLLITYKNEDQRVNSLKLSGHHFAEDYDLQIEPFNNDELDKTKDRTEDFDNDFEVINDVNDDVGPKEVQIEEIQEEVEPEPERKEEEIYEEIAPVVKEEPKEVVNPEPEPFEEEVKVAEEPFQEINEDTIAAERRAEEKLAHSDQAQKSFTTSCLLAILGAWFILLILQRFY